MTPPPELQGHPRVGPFQRLAGHTGALLGLALLVGSVCRPYWDLNHDARYYAFQTQNRISDGAFSDDLFFKYGSQDEYSLFSAVMAPPAEALRMRPALFLVYLLGDAFLLLAVIRLTFALIGRNPAAVATVLYVSSTKVFFGGLLIFGVNEPFLTPRLLTDACVLFALERLLTGRFRSALAYLAAGSALHPLMALPGLMVVGGWWAWTRLPVRVNLGLLGLTGAVGAFSVLHGPTAAKLYGVLDPAWYENVRAANPCTVPARWRAEDYTAILAALGLTVWFAVRSGDRALSRVAILAAASGLLGLLGSVVGCQFGHALLIQAQPCRALWLMQFLAVPIAAKLAWSCFQDGTLRRDWWALPAVAGVLFCRWDGLSLWLLPICLTEAVLYTRGLTKDPRRPDWASATLLWGVGSAVVMHQLYLWAVLGANQALLATQFGPIHRSQLFLMVLDPVIVMGLAYLLLRRLPAGWVPRLIWAIPVALVIQSAVYWPSRSEDYLRKYDPYQAEKDFVVGVIRAHDDGPNPPTVYWPSVPVQGIWFDLGGTAYSSTGQNGGNLFHRATALESVRRAGVTRPFERVEFIRNRDFYGMAAALRGNAPPKVIPLRVGYAVAWVAERIFRLIGRKDYLVRTDAVFLSDAFREMDNGKARRELGWNPRPIAETVRDAIDWHAQREQARTKAA